ncbi:PLP-dependent aminotransferase family protein [Actinospica durhamensis]|uniref:PLP-dependent aminotransferase family protein n=1 Tax=Actinospica durhamensis TaxID=1508375 RepID=A0A941EWA1_9ACTN|nr:PLP-dependent aminotransferase family protein [Actinospica durhamensis]MBR7838463.1 PLP-dependent aminotransferase family protein [Actinospica durhamensis]
MPGSGHQDYQGLADEFADRIAAGALRPGERLPTQRAYARGRGIAPSTATRVYRELVRRGLATGEVGRGTFVRAAPAAAGPALAEPSPAPIDLELNYPVIPEQAALLAGALGPLLRADALDDALRPIGVAGTAAARTRFAALAADEGWTPAPESVLFTGNGRQAAAAALAALVPRGGRLGVEALTYPGIKGLARQLGVTLVALPMDARGVIPEALAAVHRATPLRAVYLQPRSHNPLGLSMDAERRDELVSVLRQQDLCAVEDAVWSFLAPPDAAALAPAAPDRVVRIDSLSKRLAPGLSVGFLIAPPALRAELATAVRAGAALPGAFALEAAVRWLGDGTVERIRAGKRADAAARQRLARACLDPVAPLGPAPRVHGPRPHAYPCSYSFWWELPEPWRAETFVAAAARRGIAVTPGSAFAADPRSTPRAVRIGLASPPPGVLEHALTTLARLCAAGP